MKIWSLEYWIGLIGFTLIQVGALIGIFFVPADVFSVSLAIFFYIIRMFGITGGFHRYFAHRSYKTSRVFQFILGILGTFAAQRGPIWWASHHRIHHRYSDQKQDVHSPSNGLFQSHIGWIFMEKNLNIDWKYANDWKKFPELIIIDRLCYPLVGVFFILLWSIGSIANALFPSLHTSGFSCFFWAGLVSTTLLYHATFSVNSLCHIFGYRTYNTPDTSTNFWPIGILALGEGWHNNHHHYSASTRQGFKFWEIDISYMIIKSLSFFGIIWDIKRPPNHILKGQKK